MEPTGNIRVQCGFIKVMAHLIIKMQRKDNFVLRKMWLLSSKKTRAGQHSNLLEKSEGRTSKSGQLHAERHEQSHWLCECSKKELQPFTQIYSRTHKPFWIEVIDQDKVVPVSASALGPDFGPICWTFPPVRSSPCEAEYPTHSWVSVSVC